MVTVLGGVSFRRWRAALVPLAVGLSLALEPLLRHDRPRLGVGIVGWFGKGFVDGTRVAGAGRLRLKRGAHDRPRVRSVVVAVRPR